MNQYTIASSLLVVCWASLLVGCSGKVVTVRAEPNPQELCESICDDEAQCAPADSFDIDGCKESCSASDQAAESTGCEAHYEGLVRCTSENFSCEDTSEACDEHLRVYSLCLSGEEVDPIDEPTRPTPPPTGRTEVEEKCAQGCALSQECEMLDGTTRECTEDCVDQYEELEGAACVNAYDRLVDCALENFSCDTLAALESCERLAEEYVENCL